MIDYGVPPAADEIEVTLFGPGYGEAIAVHLGEGVWLLVDSCVDPDSKAPASGTYLEGFGVDPSQVRLSDGLLKNGERRLCWAAATTSVSWTGRRRRACRGKELLQ